MQYFILDTTKLKYNTVSHNIRLNCHTSKTLLILLNPQIQWDLPIPPPNNSPLKLFMETSITFFPFQTLFAFFQDIFLVSLYTISPQPFIVIFFPCHTSPLPLPHFKLILFWKELKLKIN